MRGERAGVQEFRSSGGRAERRVVKLESFGSDQAGGERIQETGDRRQETGDRRQETGDRRQETGDRSYCERRLRKSSLENPGSAAVVPTQKSSLPANWVFPLARGAPDF